MSCASSRGFTLIEVLIAWAVVSSVLFNVIRLELINSRHMYHYYLEMTAVMQLTNMLDRLRANERSSFRDREAYLWNVQNQHVLPSGKGSYRCNNRICIVSVRWQEKKLHQLKLRAFI